MEFTKENYKKQLAKFRMNDWRHMPLNKKEKLLQWIVDYKASEFGLPPLCHVEITELSGGGNGGLYNHSTGILSIEKELAEDCLTPPYHDRSEQRYAPLASKEVFEILMHEFRHAYQHYIIDHPEIYENTEYYKVIYLNENPKCNSVLRTYFQTKDTRDKDKGEISSLLYMLQPVERDAFLFAEKESFKFNEEMANMFPNDLEFSMHYPSVSIDTQIQRACLIFRTKTPKEDIDNILRYIHGFPVEKPLNKNMYQAIKSTQRKTLKEWIFDMKAYHCDDIRNYKELVCEYNALCEGLWDENSQKLDNYLSDIEVREIEEIEEYEEQEIER